MTIKPIIVPEDYSPDNMPPDEIAKLHREGPNEHNAEIVLMENGIEIPGGRFVFRRSLARKLGGVKELLPEVPEHVSNGMQVKESVIGQEGPPPLRKGAPPIYQRIYRLCGSEEGTEEEEIIRDFRSLGWFEGVPFAGDESIRNAMDLMKSNMIIIYDDDLETWHQGTKPLEKFYDFGKEGYEPEEGPYPVIKLIRDTLSDRGSMKSYELLDHLMSWNWVVSREYGRKWINHCVDKEYIRHVGSKVLEPYRAIG